jgi:hypothetical protein
MWTDGWADIPYLVGPFLRFLFEFGKNSKEKADPDIRGALHQDIEC